MNLNIKEMNFGKAIEALKKDEKGHNSQCVFAMQGKEELNEFSLYQIFNNKDASIFKEMVKRAIFLSTMKKLTSKE